VRSASWSSRNPCSSGCLGSSRSVQRLAAAFGVRRIMQEGKKSRIHEASIPFSSKSRVDVGE
jgi:hypothetical protein